MDTESNLNWPLDLALVMKVHGINEPEMWPFMSFKDRVEFVNSKLYSESTIKSASLC